MDGDTQFPDDLRNRDRGLLCGSYNFENQKTNSIRNLPRPTPASAVIVPTACTSRNKLRLYRWHVNGPYPV